MSPHLCTLQHSAVVGVDSQPQGYFHNSFIGPEGVGLLESGLLEALCLLECPAPQSGCPTLFLLLPSQLLDTAEFLFLIPFYLISQINNGVTPTYCLALGLALLMSSYGWGWLLGRKAWVLARLVGTWFFREFMYSRPDFTTFLPFRPLLPCSGGGVKQRLRPGPGVRRPGFESGLCHSAA